MKLQICAAFNRGHRFVIKFTHQGGWIPKWDETLTSVSKHQVCVSSFSFFFLSIQYLVLLVGLYVKLSSNLIVRENRVKKVAAICWIPVTCTHGFHWQVSRGSIKWTCGWVVFYTSLGVCVCVCFHCSRDSRAATGCSHGALTDLSQKQGVWKLLASQQLCSEYCVSVFRRFCAVAQTRLVPGKWHMIKTTDKQI